MSLASLAGSGFTEGARRRALAFRAGLALAQDGRETTIAELFRAALALEPSLVNHRVEFFEVALWALGEAVRS